MKTLLLVVLLSFILGSLTVPTSCSDQGATTLELNEAFEAENTLGLDVEKTVEKLTRCQGEICEVKCQKICKEKKPVLKKVLLNLKTFLQNPTYSSVFKTVCEQKYGNLFAQDEQFTSTAFRNHLLNYPGSALSKTKTKPLDSIKSDIEYAEALSNLFNGDYKKMRKYIFVALANLKKGFDVFLRQESFKIDFDPTKVEEDLEVFRKTDGYFIQFSILGHTMKGLNCGGLLEEELCSKQQEGILKLFSNSVTFISNYYINKVKQGTQSFCKIEDILSFNERLDNVKNPDAQHEIQVKESVDKLHSSMNQFGVLYEVELKNTISLVDKILGLISADKKVQKTKKRQTKRNKRRTKHQKRRTTRRGSNKAGRREKYSRRVSGGHKQHGTVVDKHFKSIKKMIETSFSELHSHLDKRYKKIERSVGVKTLDVETLARRFIRRPSGGRSSGRSSSRSSSRGSSRSSGRSSSRGSSRSSGRSSSRGSGRSSGRSSSRGSSRNSGRSSSRGSRGSRGARGSRGGRNSSRGARGSRGSRGSRGARGGRGSRIGRGIRTRGPRRGISTSRTGRNFNFSARRSSQQHHIALRIGARLVKSIEHSVKRHKKKIEEWVKGHFTSKATQILIKYTKELASKLTNTPIYQPLVNVAKAVVLLEKEIAESPVTAIGNVKAIAHEVNGIIQKSQLVIRRSLIQEFRKQFGVGASKDQWLLQIEKIESLSKDACGCQ